MKNFNKKVPIIIALVLIAVLATYFFTKEDNYEFVSNEELYTQQNTTPTEAENQTIVIHIAGEVNNPGIVSIPSGSRISDAIDEAGGTTSIADISKVNLAYVLRRRTKNLYS